MTSVTSGKLRLVNLTGCAQLKQSLDRGVVLRLFPRWVNLACTCNAGLQTITSRHRVKLQVLQVIAIHSYGMLWVCPRV